MGDLILVRDAIKDIPAKVSERRFRETARGIGLNVLDGRQMMVRRTDVPDILKAMTPCSKSSSGAVRRTGKSSAPLQVNASAKALALLTSPPLKLKQRTSNRD